MATSSVCSRCGTPAGSSRWCSGCGLNLSLQDDLPTAEAFAAKEREAEWLAERQAEAKTAAETERLKREAEERSRAEQQVAEREEAEQKSADEQGLATPHPSAKSSTPLKLLLASLRPSGLLLD